METRTRIEMELTQQMTNDSASQAHWSNSADILVVDDEEPSRMILGAALEALGCVPRFAVNGFSALASIETKTPELILLDGVMPEMDGLELLSTLKRDKRLAGIPVVVVSGVRTVERISEFLLAGADDYIAKPFNLTLLEARVRASLAQKRAHDESHAYRRRIEEYNLKLESRVREEVRKTTESHASTIFALSELAESRDPETGEHLRRIREYCKALAEGLMILPRYASQMDAEYVIGLYEAAPLHDIGKVGVPDRILLKPGKLTPDEFDIMKTHAKIGADTLRRVEARNPGNQFVRRGIEVAQSHHERWNGSGYPDGISGEAIPLSARILAVADVYDALTSKRPYKDAFPHDQAVDMITGDRGTHFAPDMVDAFHSLKESFRAIRAEFHEDSVNSPE